ncbi:MAG TPA: endonuclease, partial [Tenuifilaceae bacterium]|nr:endonuclease [Tenuifilaceae bacterium]
MKNRLSVLNEKFRSLTRKGTLLISLLLSFQILLGQIPSGYYDAAQGKSGAELKTALYNTIKDHTVISYSGLWTAYQNTDEKSSGKIWDMYSDIPGGTPPYEYTYSTDQCGSYSSEGDCYNREHSFPKSWFNDASPMYSDLFHIYPTDGKVNGMRSNYIFGNVENVSWTSLNGSKLGTSTESGATLTEFEPIDEYKGDFARTYFYMATRYENLIASWVGNAADGDEILAGNSYPAYKDWYVQLLLRWHKEDPVSQKEIDRNNAVYNDYQHNRNPFIDHPEYAEEIWGTPTGSISFTSTPITSATVNTAYSYNITATGGDGSAITISTTTKPDWLTIASTGDGTAILSGTPSSGDVGTGNVVLSASDGTNSTTQSFSITVSDNTTTLSFTSTPITSATVNTAYSYNITATGGNGSTITISTTTKPDWLTIASTGDGTAILSGTPSSGDVGTGNVVLSASDGTNSTTQSFSITITSATNIVDNNTTNIRVYPNPTTSILNI